MATVTPFLWFKCDLAEPIAYYRSIFPDFAVVVEVEHNEAIEAPGTPLFMATIEICGQQLILLNGGPVDFGFTEALSMFVSVDTQDEVDNLWSKLTADGGEPGRCGWLKDRYGLSWQIVPSVLGELIGSSDRVRAQQATDAMMRMDKLDIAGLRAAYEATA